MSEFDQWMKDGQDNGWTMPRAAWWKRLPVIRHVRVIYHLVQLERQNRFWISVGKIPTGYDEWVIYGIARGMENPHD